MQEILKWEKQVPLTYKLMVKAAPSWAHRTFEAAREKFFKTGTPYKERGAAERQANTLDELKEEESSHNEEGKDNNNK